jgi:hypothetical protein
MSANHTRAQCDKVFEQKIAFGVVCTPATNLEVRWTCAIAEMVDSRQQHKLRLVTSAALL